MTPFQKRLSPLTKRMAEDMMVRNLSPKTIDSYTYHVDKFLEYFGQAAEELSPAEIRSYGSRKVIRDAEHELQALRMRKRNRAHHLEETFDALGDVAREFHLQLQRRPVKTSHHLRRLLDLVRVYGRDDALAAIAQAHQFETYDAAYVETLLLQVRRRRELPSPTPLRPVRHELIDEIDIEPSDPAVYDRLFGTEDPESKDHRNQKESDHDQT